MSTTSSDIQAAFAPIRKSLQEVQQTHDVLRTHREDLEVAVRNLTRMLTDLHTIPTSDIPAVAVSLRSALIAVGPCLIRLQNALEDPTHFHRFCDLWGNQRVLIISAAVLLSFIEHKPLFHLDDIIHLLGNHVRLTPDDYVLGICHALSDLGRLCMRRVILRDYDLAVKGAVFATLVYDGLKELNFRNDILRRRFDAAKYDVKRLEEIVYDLSIRNLLPTSVSSPPVPKSTDVSKKRPVDKAECELPSKRGKGSAEESTLEKSGSKSTIVTEEVGVEKKGEKGENVMKDTDVVMDSKNKV